MRHFRQFFPLFFPVADMLTDRTTTPSTPLSTPLQSPTLSPCFTPTSTPKRHKSRPALSPILPHFPNTRRQLTCAQLRIMRSPTGATAPHKSRHKSPHKPPHFPKRRFPLRQTPNLLKAAKRYTEICKNRCLTPPYTPTGSRGLGSAAPWCLVAYRGRAWHRRCNVEL